MLVLYCFFLAYCISFAIASYYKDAKNEREKKLPNIKVVLESKLLHEALETANYDEALRLHEQIQKKTDDFLDTLLEIEYVNYMDPFDYVSTFVFQGKQEAVEQVWKHALSHCNDVEAAKVFPILIRYSPSKNILAYILHESLVISDEKRRKLLVAASDKSELHEVFRDIGKYGRFDMSRFVSQKYLMFDPIRRELKNITGEQLIEIITDNPKELTRSQINTIRRAVIFSGMFTDFLNIFDQTESDSAVQKELVKNIDLYAEIYNPDFFATEYSLYFSHLTTPVPELSKIIGSSELFRDVWKDTSSLLELIEKDNYKEIQESKFPNASSVTTCRAVLRKADGQAKLAIWKVLPKHLQDDITELLYPNLSLTDTENFSKQELDYHVRSSDSFLLKWSSELFKRKQGDQFHLIAEEYLPKALVEVILGYLQAFKEDDGENNSQESDSKSIKE